MKNKFFRIATFAQKIDRKTIQMILAIVVLTMLVLGAGAPLSGGDVIG